jgi:hypothetical protein
MPLATLGTCIGFTWNSATIFGHFSKAIGATRAKMSSNWPLRMRIFLSKVLEEYKSK